MIYHPEGLHNAVFVSISDFFQQLVVWTLL